MFCAKFSNGTLVLEKKMYFVNISTWPFICIILIHFNQGYFVPSLVWIILMGLEKKLFKFRYFVFAWILFTQRWIVPSLFEMGWMVLEKLKTNNVILLFRYYLPLENGVALHLKIKLNPLHLRMLCAKFGWNWHCGSDEDVIWLFFYNRYLRTWTWLFI